MVPSFFMLASPPGKGRAMDRELEELRESFGLGGRLSFSRGEGGLVFVEAETALCKARVSLYGAQVLNFAPLGERDLLWLSPKALFEKGKAIRGGVPVCFPWFGRHPQDPALPQHGYARLADWELLGAEESVAGELELRLGLPPLSLPGAPPGLRAELGIGLGSELSISLLARNVGETALSFSAALHSYFAVSGEAGLSVAGIGGLADDGGYADRGLEIDGEIDQVFEASRGPYRIEDPAFARRILVEKENSATTVIWRPGQERAAAMADVGRGAEAGMLCVEAVRAGANKISLGPGEEESFGTRIGLSG